MPINCRPSEGVTNLLKQARAPVCTCVCVCMCVWGVCGATRKTLNDTFKELPFLVVVLNSAFVAL
jgi:hypothetical protein